MAHDFDGSPTRVHGGISYKLLSTLGVSGDEILDLSVNVNPYGPAPAVVAAIRTASFAAYPDPQASQLKEAIGCAAGVAPASVVVGNGAADLLWTLARTLLGPGRKALIAEPTFCEFKAACQATQASVCVWRAAAQHNFRFCLEALSDAVAEERPHVVYLCNPNSPTGQYVAVEDIAGFARDHPDLLVILDEAFLSLSRHHRDAAYPLPANVIRLRSFTKEHTIAGLRIGYLLTTEPLARAVESQRPAWTINAVAEAAALCALQEESFVAASRVKIFADLEAMQDALRGLGLSPLPTSTLYFLTPMPGPFAWREKLLKHRILVRDCASYGLPEYIRLCSRPAEDVARLVTALKMELENL